jgi:thiamine biosynthesis lipoprotein
MMGAVLSLWHDAREAGNYIPSPEALAEASLHVSFDSLEIDENNNTVRITDKDARIDVGALGKGYATEMAARHLESKGATSYVLNIGGNIRTIGTKPDGSGWGTGIKDPKDPNANFIKKITISDISCVTSGDYERYFTVNKKKYHHIIDKDTLMPAEYFSSITILTKNSGLADALSTALFCMSYEDGMKLLESFENVDVLWVYPNGETKMTEGFEARLMK